VAVNYPHVATILAGFCLMMVIIAETSRLPIDNQETHLELTMIHEAMVLEYSGPSLAFIEIGSYIKQIIWFGLLAHILFPTTVALSAGMAALVVAILYFAAKILCFAAVVAVLEVLISKMRLFRVVDYFGFSIVFGVLAAISSLMGI
jgi:formate hydrogenlyase subunit 4